MSPIDPTTNNNSVDDTELDPEIAALLDLSDDDLKPIEKPAKVAKPEKKETQKKERLKPEDNPFLMAVVDGEKEELKNNFIKIKDSFENTNVREEKSELREKIISAYWNFYRSLTPRVATKLSQEKFFCLRYNLVDPNILSEKQLAMIKSIPINTESDHIFYIDEWLKQVGEGNLDKSVVDETLVKKKKDGTASLEKLERKRGAREAEIQVIKTRNEKVLEIETQLFDLVNSAKHSTKPGFFAEESKIEFFEPYTNEQREILSQVMEACKTLSKIDRDLNTSYKSLADIDEDIAKLEEETGGEIDLDESNEIIFEFNTVKQMIKMCVGRQGNHFPFLSGNYLTDEIREVATKENILQIIEDVEKLDPSLFVRTYKGEDHRIVPFIVIVPCYGDFGVCWDPIPKNNRATGRGRLAIPLFPKNLKTAVITAIADLRWQVAKEKAQYYWMEEGLTGRYYEYYVNEKLKGDIKKFFVDDYILWINWESQGVQKLHKDVRPVFWRMLPFPQEVKENLKNRGFFYSELYKKDKIRESSLGS